MKKLIFISLVIFSLVSSGCGIINPSSLVLPDDLEFITLIEELDTPQKIGNYMEENFTYEYNSIYNPDPYTLWKIKKGDCNDMSTFGVFIANYHGYETYLIKICYKNYAINHYLAIYRENDLYNFSSNQYYFPVNYDNFSDIVKLDSQLIYYFYGYIWSKYIVYDYWNNIIEQTTK